MEILRPNELARIERDYATGLPARAILEIFRPPPGAALAGHLPQVRFRPGWLPRSRRVGKKGKHRGSTGVYPVEAVRRINAIKKMMAQGHTLEEIRASFVFFKNQIDQVDRELHEVLDGFASALHDRPFGQHHKKKLTGELGQLRARAGELVKAVSRFGSAVTARVAEGNVTSQPREGR